MYFLQRIKNSIRGFTLVELILVMAVLGVMATTLIIAINPLGQFQKSRDAQRKSDLRQIQSALEMFRSDNGSYPTSLTNCSGTYLGNASCTVKYMSKIPSDPKSGSYVYTPGAAPASTYTLKACLENVNDTQKDSTNTCAGTTVSYTLVNP